MPSHCCDCCLKPILTLAGVKQHITQSAACQQQWNWVLKCMASVASVDDNQIGDELDDAPGMVSDWYDESDGNNSGHDNLNIHKGPLVQQLWTYAEPKPIYPPSRCASVADDVEDGPALTNRGCFVKQYMGAAAHILGSRPTVYEVMEKAENTSSGGQWAPFQNEEEWELACFLMKNVGQMRIDDFLKLSLVCQSGHAYADSEGKNQIYDEMWTVDWWWDVQGKLPVGTTVAPIILLSDKTSLSVFSGNKKAWLLKCFEKKTHSLAGYHLFHHAMSLLLRPLVDAGCDGKVMCLVACNKESWCLCCLVQSNKQGDKEECVWCSMADTLKMLHCKHRNGQSRKFDDEDLPFTNIFACITPNILHQLHKGIFHDHLLQWCTSIVGEKEVDAHFQVMSQYPGLCHFTKGILMVSPVD
ncbi:hypothetical protein BKA83DRAFT_4125394 [Pisolithus microcarpus]|nr:hypothetical protein BKA83DRAFT_4125394 [Pisolithus microcarpus]